VVEQQLQQLCQHLLAACNALSAARYTTRTYASTRNASLNGSWLCVRACVRACGAYASAGSG
jgi:hypothetical protein